MRLSGVEGGRSENGKQSGSARPYRSTKIAASSRLPRSHICLPAPRARSPRPKQVLDANRRLVEGSHRQGPGVRRGPLAADARNPPAPEGLRELTIMKARLCRRATPPRARGRAGRGSSGGPAGETRRCPRPAPARAAGPRSRPRSPATWLPGGDPGTRSSSPRRGSTVHGLPIFASWRRSSPAVRRRPAGGGGLNMTFPRKSSRFRRVAERPKKNIGIRERSMSRVPRLGYRDDSGANVHREGARAVAGVAGALEALGAPPSPRYAGAPSASAADGRPHRRAVRATGPVDPARAWALEGSRPDTWWRFGARAERLR